MKIRSSPLVSIPLLTLALVVLPVHLALALPEVTEIDFQPVAVHIERLQEALDYLGEPLSDETKNALGRALQEEDQDKALQMVQAALDPHCLLDIAINPESRVKVEPGPAQRRLVENGWSVFLLKVRNAAGVTAELEAKSRQAKSVPGADAKEVRDRWMELDMFGDRPLNKNLSGVGLEYRLIQLYSRDTGKRSAVVSFHVGQGTQDLGFRSDQTLTFDCLPATPVKLHVVDENGAPTTASFEIRDPQGRVYPAPSKRLAPDFKFHPQIYRADGESISLPEGTYTVRCRRGPEYFQQEREVTVAESPTSLSFKLQRWVDPAQLESLRYPHPFYSKKGW